jgi:hypothetical protein
MKKILLAFLVLASVSMTQAQRIKLLSGDAKEIKGQTKLNAVFTYENMSVGKFPKEQEYIESKKAEYNKKEAGKGDKWAEAWVGDRKARFEPQFVELFEKNSAFAAGNYADAKYTMVINTSRTEPGFNIMISRKNAEIDMEVVIIETATKREVAKYSIKSAPGRTFGGYDYDTGSRIEESYAAAGKYFGKNLMDDIK